MFDPSRVRVSEHSVRLWQSTKGVHSEQSQTHLLVIPCSEDATKLVATKINHDSSKYTTLGPVAEKAIHEVRSFRASSFYAQDRS